LSRLVPLHQFTLCLNTHSSFRSLSHHSFSLSFPVSPFIQPFTPCLTIHSAFTPCLITRKAFCSSYLLHGHHFTPSLITHSVIHPFTPVLSTFTQIVIHCLTISFNRLLLNNSVIHTFIFSSPPHSSFHSMLTTSFILRTCFATLFSLSFLLTKTFILSLPAHHLIHPFISSSPPHSSFHSLLTTSFSFSFPASPHPSISPSLHFSPLNYSFTVSPPQ
jgi:hypothetical protein